MSAPEHPMDDERLEQRLFAELAAGLAPAALAVEQRAAMRARIAAQIAPPPAGTTTYRPADEGWFEPAPSVQMKLLRRDSKAGTQELLVRLGPGVRVPAHTHRQEEQMIILEGECQLGGHLLKAGDTHIAPPGSWHPAITVEHSVLFLLRSEYPLPVG
jgi:quercetin dioxygenase-like cupin family protein